MKKINKHMSKGMAFGLLFGFCITVLAGCSGCSKDGATAQTGSGTEPQPTSGTLLFHSGFEPNSVVGPVRPESSDDDITGIDNSVSAPNNWVDDIEKKGPQGRFNLQYQGGDASQRWARIVPEPGNSSNSILHFWLKEPNVPTGGGSLKSRIQGNIYGGKHGIKELYQSVRMYLPKDMETVKTYPDKISWLTIFELWNNITWSLDVPYGFRITVGMGKPTAESRELYFMVDAEDCLLDGTITSTGDPRQKYVRIWHQMDQGYAIPVEKWLTLEYYIKEGNAENGRFWMAVTPEGGQKRVLFDIKGFTHGTGDPNPDGITDWNPIKLYTSAGLTKHMMDNNKALELYWDDFELWENRAPEN